MQNISINRIQDTFELLDDWEQRYQYLIELGSKLPELEPQYKTKENQVMGCMSQVWFKAKPSDENPEKIELMADCDTSVVKGIVALLVVIYSGKTPKQALAIDTDKIFNELGIYDHLSPTRHFGVYAMVEKIKGIFQAYSSQPYATPITKKQAQSDLIKTQP